MSELNNVYFLSLSGGLDSTISGLKILEDENKSHIYSIFINYGQKSVEQEWVSVIKIGKKFKEYFKDKDLSFHKPIRINIKNDKGYSIFDWSKSKLITGTLENTPYLENRNMILISIIASFAETKITEKEKAIIITGFRGGYNDTNQVFVDSMNNLFKNMGTRVEVSAPIINYRKKTPLLKDHAKYRDFFSLTWSCYTPKDNKPCGVCSACRDREKALNWSS